MTFSHPHRSFIQLGYKYDGILSIYFIPTRGAHPTRVYI